MRRFILAELAAIVLLAYVRLVAAGEAAPAARTGRQPVPRWYPYADAYNAWQRSRPLVFAAVHNSVPRDHLVERMERFKACGLNTLMWCKPTKGLHMFEAAHQAALEWSCGSRGGTEAIATALKIPGCSFVIAGDEPSREDELPEIAAITDWVRKNHPDKPVFANLSITKIDHDLYIETCRPDLFSFDHYPLQRDGQTHDHYLYNLAWGLQTARKHRLPYWMYLQSYGREATKPRYAYRVPDEADLRFLVFSFLAHGGTGIMFFTYYGYPESMVDDLGVAEEGRAPISQHKYENTVLTRAWYAVRDVAPEVQNLGRALVNLRCTGEVAYSGNGILWDRKPPVYSKHNPKAPVTCPRFAGRGPLRAVRTMGADDMGLLVSFFSDQSGEEYFMVVNLMHGKNLSKSDEERTVELSFTRDIERIERLNRFTGRVEVLSTAPAENDARSLVVHLEGGTGDLFKWHNGRAWHLRGAK